MTRERIDSLEADKVRHHQDAAALQAKISELEQLKDRLAPENAQLREALGDAVASDQIATLLNLVGGLLLGVASFVPDRLGTEWRLAVAGVGAALLASAVLVTVVSSIRHRH